MKRRNFVKNTLVGATGILAGSQFINAGNDNIKNSQLNSFHLKYAPHDGMFTHSAGKDIIDQLHFMADQGFMAFEDNEMRNRPISQQEAMASTMQKRGLQMGVFVAHEISWTKPNLTNGDKTLRTKFLQEIKESVTIAKRVNAKWMTVVPGYVDLQKEMATQTSYVIETLRQASEILEPHNIVMVLEPLNFFNHPGMFLYSSAQAYQICKAVNSPNCKILFDIYHQQVQEGNLIPNITNYWDEIVYFQIGDNPGRNEPTTGEVNYNSVFKYIYSRGYQGILGMEHGNSRPDKQGEMTVIEAYKKVDKF